jgi:hypothetical protein
MSCRGRGSALYIKTVGSESATLFFDIFRVERDDAQRFSHLNIVHLNIVEFSR